MKSKYLNGSYSCVLLYDNTYTYSRGETFLIAYQHVSYFRMRKEQEGGECCPVKRVQLSTKSFLKSKVLGISVNKMEDGWQKRGRKRYALRIQNTAFITGRSETRANITRCYYFTINYWKGVIPFGLQLVISGSKTQIRNTEPGSRKH